MRGGVFCGSSGKDGVYQMIRIKINGICIIFLTFSEISKHVSVSGNSGILPGRNPKNKPAEGCTNKINYKRSEKYSKSNK